MNNTNISDGSCYEILKKQAEDKNSWK